MPTQLLHRREFLRVGSLTPVGLGLPALLQASAQRKSKPARAKACLLIFMEGGPSHIDMWDMKPDAPPEIRGEFKPIQTAIPGLHVCEHLPLFAKWIDRFTQVRSVTHTITDHNAGAYYALTGAYPVDGSRLVVAESPRNFPPFGAVLAKLRPRGSALPEFVHIPEIMSNNGFDIPGELAGFLGAAYDPLVTGDPSLPDWRVPGMTPAAEVSLDRLADREDLFQQLDRSLGALENSPALERMELFHRKAVNIIRSAQARRAFDIAQEPLKLRERYGMDRGSDRSIEARKFGGLPHLGQSMLLARRLIEAGVSLVTLITGRRIDQAWDTHRQHFDLMKQSLLPPFDQAMSALLEDMEVRGLLDETLVVIMGEFGRTPKIGYATSNAGAARNGRDHWPYCYTVLFAGAGVPRGQIIGASDRQAAYPSREPYKPEDIAATIYAALGIPTDTEIMDAQQRPYALTRGRVIDGVLGR